MCAVESVQVHRRLGAGAPMRMTYGRRTSRRPVFADSERRCPRLNGAFPPTRRGISPNSTGAVHPADDLVEDAVGEVVAGRGDHPGAAADGVAGGGATGGSGLADLAGNRVGLRGPAGLVELGEHLVGAPGVLRVVG